MMKKQFRLVRDKSGFAMAIAYGRKQWVLHLETGTAMNERNAEWIVGVLNGNRVEPPKGKP